MAKMAATVAVRREHHARWLRDASDGGGGGAVVDGSGEAVAEIP